MGGLEGKFSVSFGPNPEFRLWIWTWTKLSNIFSKVYYMFKKCTDFSNGGRFCQDFIDLKIDQTVARLQYF